MAKKIFIVFLILSFLNLIGCFSVGEVTKDEFLKKKGQKVYLFTENFEKYSFEAGRYIVKNDTLNGIGNKEYPGFGVAPFKGSLSLDKVNLYQVEDIDGLKTVGLILGIALVGVLIFSAIVMEGIADAFHGD